MSIAPLQSLIGSRILVLRELENQDLAGLRSQFVISNPGGGRRTPPHAFTEQGVARRLNELEEKTEALSIQQDAFAHNTRAQLKQVFEAIRQLMTPPDPPKRPIGFVTPAEKDTKGKS
jgi:hypothetical protein